MTCGRANDSAPREKLLQPPVFFPTARTLSAWWGLPDLKRLYESQGEKDEQQSFHATG
jgi:hypothetical protein